MPPCFLYHLAAQAFAYALGYTSNFAFAAAIALPHNSGSDALFLYFFLLLRFFSNNSDANLYVVLSLQTLPAGHGAVEPFGPAHNFLQAQYCAESLDFFSPHLCLALNDLRAAAE